MYKHSTKVKIIISSHAATHIILGDQDLDVLLISVT